MNNELDQKFDIEIGRNWPEQIIVDHAPYWRAWRRHTKVCNSQMELFYNLVGRTWIHFSNGKNLGPRLMMDWMQFVKSIPSDRSETGLISNMHAGRYRSVVASYLRWLRLMGAIMMDPSDCMPYVRITPPAPKQIYTHEEYLRMVNYGEEHGSYATHLWLLILGYHTGMSLIDCCTLNWDQVRLPDDGPCYIQRMRAKLVSRYGTKSMCTVPILVGSELWVRFKRLQSRRDLELDRTDGVEYVHQDAASMVAQGNETPSHEMVAFITAALGEDRKRRSFRNLRNTFASRLINAGTDCVLVSKMTGHQTVQQLADYVVPNQASMQEAILKGLRSVEGATTLPADTKASPSTDLCQIQ